MKKTLGVLLVLVMVVSSMTTMAFAADEVAYPNFYGSVWVENYDCIHKTDAEVSVKISKEGMEDIVIPLPYDEEFEEYYCEVNLDEDEMEKFLTDSFQGGCPYYRLEDEYKTVRKQM